MGGGGDQRKDVVKLNNNTDNNAKPKLNKHENNLMKDVFVSKLKYQEIASQFHQFHQHDLNVFLHGITTPLGQWGVIQLFISLSAQPEQWISLYGLFVALTTPFSTGTIHTILLVMMYYIPSPSTSMSILAIIAGYAMQDISHYLTCEPAFMYEYISKSPFTLVWHTAWLMPLVIDSFLMRDCFLPMVVSRNRTLGCVLKCGEDLKALREWIVKNVEESKETTHVWPHRQERTSCHTKAIEDDPNILSSFQTLFPPKHYTIQPIQSMNEIYVTAIGSKKSINSDAVFYTPHTDGPYWFLPFASCYRVLVGLTHNQMVRTRFNLQYGPMVDKVIDQGDVLGFDYNREVHLIDHVDGKVNEERRSVLKLHYVVYPRGWDRYGAFCSRVNSTYNTWARGNFLKTLRPESFGDVLMAWWIWLTTWFNAMQEIYLGWNNVVYLSLSYFLAPRITGVENAFLILTSFRHYVVYITTFAYRQPMVSYGTFVRDAKLYKTIALIQLTQRLLPYVNFPDDIPCLAIATIGFGITILATVRLGNLRTYFGTELGFVEPKWIEGFPYGYIPHPMIVGQVLAFGALLFHWKDVLGVEETWLLGGHIGFYVLHMFQEIFYSAY